MKASAKTVSHLGVERDSRRLSAASLTPPHYRRPGTPAPPPAGSPLGEPLTWADAVLEALCFGWIDSVSQPIDADRRRQRWTPRSARSTWSRVNIAHVERLIAEGRMHPAGLAAFARRAPERSGVYSHESGEVALDPRLQALVDASPGAVAFLAEATPGYRKAVRHWIMSAAQEATRERRTRQLIADCEAGLLVPPQRPGRQPAWLGRAADAARAAMSG